MKGNLEWELCSNWHPAASNERPTESKSKLRLQAILVAYGCILVLHLTSNVKKNARMRCDCVWIASVFYLCDDDYNTTRHAQVESDRQEFLAAMASPSNGMHLSWTDYGPILVASADQVEQRLPTPAPATSGQHRLSIGYPLVCYFIPRVELPLQIFKDLEDFQDFEGSSRIFVSLEDLQGNAKIYNTDQKRLKTLGKHQQRGNMAWKRINLLLNKRNELI